MSSSSFIPPFETSKVESDIEDIVIVFLPLDLYNALIRFTQDGIARKRPATIRYLCPFNRKLEPGKTYRWCACGKSADVFCDDSCNEHDLKPMEFTIEKRVSIHSLCACRYTATPPFCDGAHYRPEVGRDEYEPKAAEECRAKCQCKHVMIEEADDDYE